MRRLLSRMRIGRNILRSTEAIALVEFAVSLPLMLVMIVGIFDFGNAFNLKQKLTNAAAVGARFAASLPTNDLSSAGIPTPKSVLAVRDAIDKSLIAEGLPDCGLGALVGATSFTASKLTWGFQSQGSCNATVTLTIERGYYLLTPDDNINLIGTHVSLAYPYSWYFGHVTGLLGGSGPALPGQILVDSYVPNLD